MALSSGRPPLKRKATSRPRLNMSLCGAQIDCVCTSGAMKSRSGWPIFGSLLVYGCEEMQC